MKTQALFHVVARARWSRVPLGSPDHARWLWRHLRRAFPEAVAVVLMPNHVHLIVPGADPRLLLRRLRAVLSSFSRVLRQGQLWERVPWPVEIVGEDKVRRQVRYVLLNPCRPFPCGSERHKLTDDPLAWPWSTARDLWGASAAPWPGTRTLGRWMAEADPVRLYAYVAGDPSVVSGGRAAPVRVEPAAVPGVDLRSVIRAVSAAHRLGEGRWRGDREALRDFVGLARRQGWRDTMLIARASGLHPTTVRRLGRERVSEGVEAAAMCLGSRRFWWDGRFELRSVRR